MTKYTTLFLITVCSLIVLVLTACGNQATEEPATEPATETATEQPAIATEEATQEAPTEVPQVNNYEPEEISEGVFNLEYGSPPVNSSLTSDAPIHSYMFSASERCATQVSVSGNSTDTALEASLIDFSSDVTMESASVGASNAVFTLPANAKGKLFGNLFQVDVKMDPALSESQSFTIALAENCDDDSVTLTETGPAPMVEQPVTFPTDDKLWSMQYPDGWGIEIDEQGAINLANDPALLEAVKKDDFVISAGEVGLTILFVPTESAVELNLGGANTVERASYLAALLTPDSDDSLAKIGEVELIRHEGQPLLGRVPYSYGEVYQGMTVVWDVSDDAIGVAVLMLPPGTYLQTERTVYAILESIQFNAPVKEVISSLSKENK